MSNFKGTKGKWTEHKYAKGTVIGFNNRTIANCMGYSTNADAGEHILESYANALLISKAPEMLEMLEELLNNSDVPNEIYDKAKKLIKQATEL